MRADAVFLGAVGGPAWVGVPHEKRPEAGLLQLRKSLQTFANLRPVVIFSELAIFSCLRQDIVAKGVDLLVVRELTGGIYFGEPSGEEVRNGERRGFDTMVYTESEIRRIAHVAFCAARDRKQKVTSVDKANVLHVSRLWREIVIDVSAAYPDVTLEHMYVDNAAMQLVSSPSAFDVILTSNLFGDILSDQAAAIAGSLGMLASASTGTAHGGLFEPAHGSAPEIAGKNICNPLAAILSAAMMLRMACKASAAAAALESAVRKVIADGFRTSDLVAPGEFEMSPVSCSRMGELVRERL